jgi:hypothetical protein
MKGNLYITSGHLTVTGKLPVFAFLDHEQIP